jgi:hypothetical protein
MMISRFDTLLAALLKIQESFDVSNVFGQLIPGVSKVQEELRWLLSKRRAIQTTASRHWRLESLATPFWALQIS